MKKCFTKNLFLLISLFILFVFMSCSEDDSVAPINTELKSQIEKMTFYTESYPPFNYEEEGNLSGVSIEILIELFKKMNVNFDPSKFNLTDWNVGYKTTLETNNTMLFSAVRNTERENLFKWVGPIAPHKDIIISLENSNVTINNSTDLLNYKVGVIKDYSSIQLLNNYGFAFEDLSVAENVNELYSMLANGTVDCIAYSEIGHKLILSAFLLSETDYKTSFVMSVSELYYAFNLNTSVEVINYFQDALNELTNDKGADGTSVYDRIISNYNIINVSNDGISNEQVINLVNKTSDDINIDFSGTVLKINNSEPPYRNADFPSLYTFIYDTTLTVVAHATNSLIVGANFKGKPDVSGKKFRDEILSGALNNGTGWVDYIYSKPGEGGLYYKTTYYKLTTGSNGIQYVVCAGKYR